MYASSRRRFLHHVAACSLAAGSTAGCLSDGSIPGLDAPYAEWLPAPEALDHTERYAVRAFDPGAIDDSSGVLAPELRKRLSTLADGGRKTVGLGRSAVETVYSLGSFAIALTGSFERDRVADSLAETGWTEQSAGDRRRFVDADRGLAAAVDTDAIVLAPLVAGERSFLDPVLAASDGETGRYMESDATLKALGDALGDGDVVVLRDGGDGVPLEGVTAVGVAWRFTEDTAKMTLGLTFPDSNSVETGRIERLTDRSAFTPHEGISVGQRGQVGVVSATAESVTPGAAAPMPALASALRVAPRTRFDFTVTADGDAVRIVHGGGDPVPASRLAIAGEGFGDHPAADQTAAGRWRGETSHDGTVVAGGDQVTVGVGADPAVQVQFRPLTDERPAVLGTGP